MISVTYIRLLYITVVVIIIQFIIIIIIIIIIITIIININIDILLDGKVTSRVLNGLAVWIYYVY